MKFLLVNTYHYLRGGDSRYTFALAGLLRAHGHEVHHFAMRHPRNLPCADERYFVDHVDFPEELAKASASSALGVLRRAIHSRDAKDRFGWILRDLRPDVVHLQNIHGHITPSILPEAVRLEVPVLWTLHDFRLVCPNTHLLSHGTICEACADGRFYRCTLKRCKRNSLAASGVASLEAYVHRLLGVRLRVNRFLSPSRFLIRKFAEMGWQGPPPGYLPPFLPPGDTTSSRTPPGGYGLYLGQLAAHKGVSTLVRAAALAPDVPLKLAGEGPERSSLEASASGLPNVRFEGHLTGAPLRNLLEGARFVVLPSECYENSPYSVLEGMGTAKPVIASNLGGLPEMVEEGETGLLFPAGDATALARCMARLWHDPESAAAMGAAGRRRVEREFSADAHYSGLMSAYSSTLSSRKTGSTLPD
jgi:glycosyltransferase involved in cell wall biosynthesis